MCCSGRLSQPDFKTDVASDPSLREGAEVATALGTDPRSGLSSLEASRRLLADGANELDAAVPLPEWRRVVSQFQDPLVYLLLAAIAIALVAWIVAGAERYPVDAVVIALVVLANGLLGYFQESKAQGAVAALARMTAATSTVIRDGSQLRLASAQLVRGDLIVLAAGDAVGADARLLHAVSLLAHEASLTGESAAVLKSAATLPGCVALGDRSNMVFSGTAISQGTGRAVVTATGMKTEVGSIAALLGFTREKPTPLQQEVGRIGRMLAVAVLCIAALVVTAILLLSEVRGLVDVFAALLLGVSLAVAAVPEGLPAILTLVLALGVQRMAARNAIVKKLSSVETLGCATVIASDKTGTLTQGQMTIVQMMTASGATRVSGAGYARDGTVSLLGDEAHAPITTGPLHAELSALLSGGSLAGNASLERGTNESWQISGDPTEAAFHVAEHKLGVSEGRMARFSRAGEIPFTAERKLMSTIEVDNDAQGARILFTKGAPDVLLGRCTRLQVGVEVAALLEQRQAQLRADVEKLSGAGLRTLGVAYRPLQANECSSATDEFDAVLERDLIFVGTVGIVDPPRAEAASAIRQAREAGIRVIMITGDHPGTALRIAADLGIQTSGLAAVTGSEIDALDDAAFAAVVCRNSVYARVAPAHKLRIVTALQAGGDVVAMTGDGVNDAPALKAADIGIAMGLTGTEVTRQAARMVLADDNFATIIHAVQEGRSIFDNLRKTIRYLLISNMGEVLTVFFGVVGASAIGVEAQDGGVVLPLLATQLLWINLVTDAAPALALGLDPSSVDIMSRRPRGLRDPMINSRMWLDVFLIGGITAAATLMTMGIVLLGAVPAATGDVATARTAGFTVLVFASLFTSLASRSNTRSVFAVLPVNWWLWGAIVVSMVLQLAVVEIGVLNVAFGTVPLSPVQWLLCGVMASAVLWTSELRKLLTRTMERSVSRGQSALPNRPDPAQRAASMVHQSAASHHEIG
jgi:P-type Ca2+ transporter type 2C